MSRLNSTPTETVAESATEPTPVDTTKVATTIDRGFKRASSIGSQGLAFARKRPVLSGAAALALAVSGYMAFNGSHGIPLAQANLPSATPSKIQSTGSIKEVEMVVGSYRKTDTMLILNNHKNYKEATMSVVVDLRACPELATIDPRSLRGQTILAKGVYQTYDSKPQIAVSQADNLKINPSKEKPKG